MSYFDFETITHGKWILAGEHAVLRGHGALVFPINAKKLTLSYRSTSPDLNANFEGAHGETLHLLFWSVFEHGLRLLDRSLNHITGSFFIANSIPIGVGMGASAALCVAVTRWFIYRGWLNEEQGFSFAKSLEDLFHGQSSGLDIVGVSAQSGMFFQQGKSTPLHQNWQPKWCLTFSGQQGLTSPCISKVNEHWNDNPDLAQKIDLDMAESVLMAQTALTNKNLEVLIRSIDLATACFQAWGLMSETMTAHMSALRKMGALAVKPTGSGGGGFVLSLWENYPNCAALGTDEWIHI